MKIVTLIAGLVLIAAGCVYIIEANDLLERIASFLAVVFGFVLCARSFDGGD